MPSLFLSLSVSSSESLTYPFGPNVQHMCAWIHLPFDLITFIHAVPVFPLYWSLHFARLIIPLNQLPSSMLRVAHNLNAFSLHTDTVTCVIILSFSLSTGISLIPIHGITPQSTYTLAYTKYVSEGQHENDDQKFNSNCICCRRDREDKRDCSIW